MRSSHHLLRTCTTSCASPPTPHLSHLSHHCECEQGTCQELEKSYFRLTSAPDPATVRCMLIGAVGGLQGPCTWLGLGWLAMLWLHPRPTHTLRQPTVARRPEAVLRAALARLLRLLRSREVNYFYALDQFKASFLVVLLK